MSRKEFSMDWEPRVCPVCKKKYIPAPEHTWKVGKSLAVCSYSCMRKEERRRGWIK